MTEKWLPINGYEGKYEISNSGRVKSIARKAKRARGDIQIRERILKTTMRGEFAYAALSNEGEAKSKPIHYLVANAFIDNPNGRPLVVHKNGDNGDNRVGNLQWIFHNEVVAEHGGWVEVGVSTKTFPNAVMKIDRDDWSKLSKLKKRFYADKRNSTAKAIYVSVDVTKDKKTLIHRLLIPDEKYIDHINGDGLDNRRENLRRCTHSENHMNRPIQSNNKIGVKGVYQRSDTGKFVAHLKAGSVLYKEEFCTLDEAIAARKKAEELHFGEFNYNEKEK